MTTFRFTAWRQEMASWQCYRQFSVLTSPVCQHSVLHFFVDSFPARRPRRITIQLGVHRALTAAYQRHAANVEPMPGPGGKTWQLLMELHKMKTLDAALLLSLTAPLTAIRLANNEMLLGTTDYLQGTRQRHQSPEFQQLQLSEWCFLITLAV